MKIYYTFKIKIHQYFENKNYLFICFFQFSSYCFFFLIFNVHIILIIIGLPSRNTSIATDRSKLFPIFMCSTTFFVVHFFVFGIPHNVFCNGDKNSSKFNIKIERITKRVPRIEFQFINTKNIT